MQLNMKESKDNLSIRRIGLCWEATRAPRGTRKPQAWAISVGQAGLLRVRYQSEKSIVKLTSKINRKVSYASTPKETFTLNQYISTELLRISREINQTLCTIKDNCDEKEFKVFRRAFGRVMGYLYLDILGPIYKEHPTLTPDELKRPSKK